MNPRRQFFLTVCVFAFLVFFCMVINLIGFRRLCRPVVFEINGHAANNYQTLMIANNDYDALLSGSSMSTNFCCTEFDKIWGTHSLKIARNATTVETFCNLIRFAMESHSVSYVQVDLGILRNYRQIDIPYIAENQKKVEDFFSDALKNYLSLENTFQSLQFCFSNPHEISRDDYEIWDNNISSEEAVKMLVKDIFATNGCAMDNPQRMSLDILEKTEVHLQKTLLPLINDYPDTTFIIFFPPYSILYYRNQDPELEVAYRKMLYSLLLNCSNVRLFDFQSASNICTNLKKYKDASHYLRSVNSWMISEMGQKHFEVTPKNAESCLSAFSQLIADCNYDFFLEELRNLSKGVK